MYVCMYFLPKFTTICLAQIRNVLFSLIHSISLSLSLYTAIIDPPEPKAIVITSYIQLYSPMEEERKTKCFTKIICETIFIFHTIDTIY